jgi:hypothetical protein
VDLAILEGLLHRAGQAFFGAVLISLVALAAEKVSKVLQETAVGLDDPKVGVLGRDVAGNLLEELPVSLLALPELILEELQFRDIGSHSHDCGNLPGLIPDGGRFDEKRNLLTGEVFKVLFYAVPLTIPEGPFRRALLASFGAISVDLVAMTAFKISEVLPEPPVRLQDPQIAIQNGQVSRHDLEIFFIW